VSDVLGIGVLISSVVVWVLQAARCRVEACDTVGGSSGRPGAIATGVDAHCQIGPGAGEAVRPGTAQAPTMDGFQRLV
jgi:hypothetical protein